MTDKELFGKSDLLRVVNVTTDGGDARVYIQDNDGRISCKEYSNVPRWILYKDFVPGSKKLNGSQHFGFIKFFDHEVWKDEIDPMLKQNKIMYYIGGAEESMMVGKGISCFRGLKPADLSVLSFDIETTGFLTEKNNKVLLISNTFRDFSGKVTRRLFKYDEYLTNKDMIGAWCKWVREVDPTIVTGHNIFGFDLPYLKKIAGKLELGRDGSAAEFARRDSMIRKDQTQQYAYRNVKIDGRHVIDTFNLSIKWDARRQLESYALKKIVKQLGLERDDRQHYDAAKIKDVYHIKEEWAKIVQYAIHDADDSLAVYDYMIKPFFFMCQYLPMNFQAVINRNSGSQIDLFMIRNYLMNSYGLPAPDHTENFQGALSGGNPGVYHNVYKVDVASMYPSIIIGQNIHDKVKDPNSLLPRMAQYFTRERLRNKQLAKTSGDSDYSHLEQSQKIFINSLYGFMGASGLLFNSPKNAELVTKTGREILTMGVNWVARKGYRLVNFDTDSFSYESPANYTEQDFDRDLKEINGLYGRGIVWEDDGHYDTVIVTKAKNYVLCAGDEVKIKGNSLVATNKEPALRQFINDVIRVLIKGGGTKEIHDLYMDYAGRIDNLSDIAPWASKKTVTAAILSNERTNEARVREAIQGKNLQEGDKINVYFRTKQEIRCVDDFDGVYDREKLYEKLFKTVGVFSNLIDISVFDNFALKRNASRRPVAPMQGNSKGTDRSHQLSLL